MRLGEAKRLWGFDGLQVGAMAPTGRWIGGRHRAEAGCRRSGAGFGDAAEAEKYGSGRVGQSRPLSAVADAKRT
jgi:hypothetical protein